MQLINLIIKINASNIFKRNAQLDTDLVIFLVE